MHAEFTRTGDPDANGSAYIVRDGISSWVPITPRTVDLLIHHRNSTLTEHGSRWEAVTFDWTAGGDFRADVRYPTPAPSAPPRPTPTPTPTPASLHKSTTPDSTRHSATIDFSSPVELRCVLDPDATARRFIPLAAIAFIPAFLLSAIPLGLAFPESNAVSIVGGVLVGIAVPIALYFSKRNNLRRVYGEQQRLLLTPQGMRKTDNAVVVEIAWRDIAQLTQHNSSLTAASQPRGRGLAGAAVGAAAGALSSANAQGITGYGSVTPLPGASRRLLAAHDRTFGRGSHLARGVAHQHPRAVVWPAEFEKDWAGGTIGAWLRHYRPDIIVTPHR